MTRSRTVAPCFVLVLAAVTGISSVSVAALIAFPAAQQAGVTPATVWDAVYTEEQAKRGKDLFGATCAACHGESLDGLESAPPLTGVQFNANWDGTTLGDLGERIRISMPADKPGSMSRPQLADVIAYLLKVDNFPAGDKPLDPQTAALMQIRFESIRPQPK